MKVLIVGGGIGGLTTALALQARGIDYTILEQSSELREVGAGITLWANAVKVLDQIGFGVGAKIRALKPEQVPTAMRDHHGRILAEIDAGGMERAFGAPAVALHRADLLRLLAEPIDAKRLVLGARCATIESDATKVKVVCANGHVESGDALVGADGFHSVVRTHLFGEQPARYAGYTSWRGVSPHSHRQLPAGEFWGRGSRCGLVPLNGNRTYWFAAKDAPADTLVPVESLHRTLLAEFGAWHPDLRTLIETTPPSAIIQRHLCDRLPLKQWSFGRITLLGDAAHPMTPNLGQGACQAMEDAAVLAQCLAEPNVGVEAALDRYQRVRIPHTTRVVNESWKFGLLGHWTNPLACGLRNFAVRVMPESMRLRHIAWVMGHEV